MKKYFAPLLFLQSIAANPIDPHVLQGSIEFHEKGGNLLEIVASDQSVIEWKEFHIDPNETTRFIQPSVSSSVMNRVLESAPSKLLGRLESNGEVFLINPNGILVGKDAYIDVGSLVASTLDTGNFEDFQGLSSAPIQIEGTIHSKGDVIIIASEIENSGVIEADRLAGLFGDSQVLYKPTEYQGIYVRGNSFQDAFTVTHKGIIRSKEAYVMGDSIIVEGEIDVSQDFGGGTVLIGSERAGKSDRFRNAKSVWIGESATISANAKIDGDGGTIIAWGDEINSCYGRLSSQGGKYSGNGGFIEVSAQMLDFRGDVSTTAACGKAGTLLLDPLDITIIATTDNLISGGPNFVPTGGACGANPGNSRITPATLVAALAGSNVTVSTAGTVGACPGDITVSSPVLWSSGNLLTLDSANNITFDPGASVQDSSVASTGGVVLIAPDSGTITINGASGAETFVGSQNGITFVGNPNVAACSRNRPDLIMSGTGPFAASFDVATRLGFDGGVSGDPATGPIDVSCGNLTMRAIRRCVCIGHGSGTVAAPVVLDIDAPITVSADGNISLEVILANSVPFGTATVAIGHGSHNFTGGGSSIIGNIDVTAAGNIDLIPFDSDAVIAIGHWRTFNAPPGAITLYQGDINVSSGNSIAVNSAFRGTISEIGHYSGITAQLNSIGDIYVSAVNDITLTGVSGSVISHFCNTANLISVTSNVNVVAGRDVNMVMVPAALGFPRCFIGARMTNATPAFLTGDVKVFAGRDLNLQNQKAGGVPSVIGHFGVIVAGDGDSDTYVGVGRNLNFLTPITNPTRIQAAGNVYVGVSGDIVSTTTSQTTFISTVNTIPVSSGGGATTCIWAGGDITATSNTFFGSQTGAGQNANIDIRAGGTITYPNNFATSDGFFFMAAPTEFQAGQLWSTALPPSRLESACLSGTADTISFNNCFTAATTTLTSPINTPTTTSIFPPVTITTTTGPITLSSPLTFEAPNTQTSIDPTVMLTPCNTCSNPTSDLLLGPGSTQISTTSGDIILGTFNNVTVNQAVTTSGTIDIGACGTLDANGNISTSTTGYVHLSGSNVNVNGGINTLNGDICFNATSGMTIASDVISTDGGTISGVAGGNLDISSLVTTSASILLMSQNMSLLAPADISSTGAEVTLLVDINNPFPPLPANPAGLGSFNMEAGTSISTATGFPLSIFTALQGLNSINGTLNGSPFAAGTLYEDTATEIWCTFAPQIIDCPSCLFQMGCSTNCPNFFFLPNGMPYTVYYKDCLELVLAQAQLSITEMLVSLHPYNEYPGWVVHFDVTYPEALTSRPSEHEPFYLRRRHLNFFNHPKTWTVYVPEG